MQTLLFEVSYLVVFIHQKEIIHLQQYNFYFFLDFVTLVSHFSQKCCHILQMKNARALVFFTLNKFKYKCITHSPSILISNTRDTGQPSLMVYDLQCNSGDLQSINHSTGIQECVSHSNSLKPFPTHHTHLMRPLSFHQLLTLHNLWWAKSWLLLREPSNLQIVWKPLNRLQEICLCNHNKFHAHHNHNCNHHRDSILLTNRSRRE